jgi:hypothetical protein
MRVIDPKIAYSMLHRETPSTQQPFHQQHQPSPVAPATNTCEFLSNLSHVIIMFKFI